MYQVTMFFGCAVNWEQFVRIFQPPSGRNWTLLQIYQSTAIKIIYLLLFIVIIIYYLLYCCSLLISFAINHINILEKYFIW